MATKSSQKSTTDSYAKFLTHLVLAGLGLDKAAAEVDRVSLAKAVNESDNLCLSLDLSEKVLNIQDGSFSIGIALLVKQAISTDTKPFLEIMLEYSAMFNFKGLASVDLVNRFASAEAKLIFWPYLRHSVTDIMSRMSVNSILLPLVIAVPNMHPESNNS